LNALEPPRPAPWPSMPVAAAPYRPRRRTADGFAFWMGVAVVLVFSQGWQLPFLGEFPIANGVLVQAGFIPAYLGALVLLALSPVDCLKGTLRQPFLILLLASVFVSTYWSIDPGTTLRRGVAVAFTTLAGVALAGRFSWRTLSEVMATAFAILVVSSFVTGALIPRIGVMQVLFPGAWRGLWQEKNILGGVMALGFAIFGAAAMMNPKRALMWSAFAALAVLLVLLSQSKTSLVALMLGGVAIGFIFVVQRGPAIGVAALWLAVTGALMLAFMIIFASDVFFGLLGKDATFTGRTKIWSAALRQIRDRPWTGFGYAAIWGDTSGRGPYAWISKDAGFTPQHAHNSWLEQWMGMGFWGLGFWGLFYLETMSLAVISVFRSKGAYLAFPFLLVFSLMTLTESIAVVYNDFRWTLFVAFAVKLALPEAEAETA
jgi:exopolysaccharide production protein ExoQ